MDTKEIQQQIDDAPDGGEVRIPAGTHELDAPLRLKPGVKLRGEGDQTLLLIKETLPIAERKEINFIELQPLGADTVHDVEISDLHLKGPGASDDITQEVASEATKGCGIVALGVAFNIRIEKVSMENVSGCGIFFFDRSRESLSHNIRIVQCRIHQSRRPADPQKFNNYKDISFYGAFFKDIEVIDNTCTFDPTRSSSPFGNDSGIAFVFNGNLGSVRNALFRGNVCDGHARHGIITNYGKMPAFDVEVRDNTCRDNRWVGIYVNTNIEEGENVLIEDNVCEHNGYGGSSDPNALDKTIRGGIVLAGCYNSTIRNNHCNGNGSPSSNFAKADASAKYAAGIRVRGKNLVLLNNETRKNKGGDIVEWPSPYDNVEVKGTKRDFFLIRFFWKLFG